MVFGVSFYDFLLRGEWLFWFLEWVFWYNSLIIWLNLIDWMNLIV